MTFPPSPFDRLPLFATDDEIAIAIVGRKRASEWKRGALRLLDAKGFPGVDALHGGRPVPLVRRWYNQYLGVENSYIQAPAVAEDRDVWVRSKRERRDDRKPKLDLDYRCFTWSHVLTRKLMPASRMPAPLRWISSPRRGRLLPKEQIGMVTQFGL